MWLWAHFSTTPLLGSAGRTRGFDQFLCCHLSLAVQCGATLVALAIGQERLGVGPSWARLGQVSCATLLLISVLMQHAR